MNLDCRNKIMATAYLQPYNNIFGMTGLAHVEGLQTLINKWIPRANFDFIYIYREKIDATHPPILNKIWEDYRQNKIPLPLGLTLIDGIGKVDDEVVEIVMQHVHEKIAAFGQLPDELKVIPDISLSATIRREVDVQLNNLYGFFSSSINTIRDTVANQILGKRL